MGAFNHIYMVLTRTQETAATRCMVLEFTVTVPNWSRRGVLEALRDVVTEWMKRSAVGRRCRAATDGRPTIEDVLGYRSDASLCRRLKAVGIQDWRIVVEEDDQPVDLDMTIAEPE